MLNRPFSLNTEYKIENPMNEFDLFSTAGCHLCEAAENLLDDLAQFGKPIGWRIVDIADDEILQARYGERIPVLKRSSDGQELHWPFDRTDLLRFLS